MTSIVYMQVGFWEKLASDTSREGIRTMLDVTDAFGNSTVITDATEEQIQKDIFLMKLIRQGNYQRCDSNYINKKVDNLNSSSGTADLFATYMLEKSPMLCDGYGAQYGVLAMSADGLWKKRFLFRGDGFNLEKGQVYQNGFMGFASQLQHPCNSMIVIDPYILTDRSNITYSLISLLDAMLPKQSQVIFHILVISILGNPEKRIVYNIKDIFKDIDQNIRNIRPQLLFSLCLFSILKGGAFHRRLVLTNNVMIDFADGINLFNENKKSIRNTTVDIVHHKLMGNDRQDLAKYNLWIEIVKEQISNAPSGCIYSTNGTKENRLLN